MARKDAELRDALSELLGGPERPLPVRAEIVESWRRVASRGLQPDRFDPMYDPDLEAGSRLERAAGPVLSQLGDDLAETETGFLLTDERGHVVERQVSDRHFLPLLDHILLAPGFFFDEADAGTNGIGSALAQDGPVVVQGGEHFADALTGMACAGVPVRDPRTGSVLGIVDVTVRAANANPLLLPLAKHAGWEIEQRLLEGVSAIEHVLHERFLRARRQARGPLVVVSEYVMLTNTAAARIVEHSDQACLWEWATRVIVGGGRSPEVMLAKGPVITSCEPVHDGGMLVGAVVSLTASGARPGEGPKGTASDRPTLGWGALTMSERSIADLVGDGLTNREVGACLFLSPHTVDAHLRHIFQKLDIRSRVELARIVAEHGEASPLPAQS